MESKITNRIDVRLEMIESKIESLTKRLEALANEMKEAVAKYDTYQIVTFVPGYVRQIEELDKEIKALEEQKRILLWVAVAE